MKKFFFLATALFAAISFSACSDDDDNGGGNGSSSINYVSEVVCQDGYGTRTLKLEYDDRNRLTKVTYGKERVLFSDQGPDLIFNKEGYIIYYADSRRKSYEYDEDGHLIKEGNYSYTWKNGDCIQCQRGNDVDVMTYSNHIANLNFEIWHLFYLDEDWPYAFAGRKSKHLPQKHKTYISCDYEYEFDEKGRPVTVYRTYIYEGKKECDIVTIKYK